VRRKQTVTNVTEAAGVVEQDGRYLLLRGQRPTVLADMWEFPTRDSRLLGAVVAEDGPDPIVDLRSYLAELGQGSVTLRHLGEIRHGITNRRITCTVYRAETGLAGSEPMALNTELGWFTPAEAARLPLAASAKRILELLDCDA